MATISGNLYHEYLIGTSGSDSIFGDDGIDALLGDDGDGVEIYYQNDLVGYVENTNDIDPLIDLVTVQATDLEAEQEVEFAIDLVEDLGLVDEPIQVSEGVWFLGKGIHPDDLNIVKPDNINSADTINTDQLWAGGDLGLDLDGEGLTVGVWEFGGVIRNTHQELNGRVSIIDTETGFSDHATHVAGTIAATGIDSDARGVANLVNLRSYDSSDYIAEIERDAHLIVASNHSYGKTAGWTIGDRDTRNAGLVTETYVWTGDYSISSTEDTDFGKYDDSTRDLDQVLFDNPHLLSVWSAGNDRNDVFTDESENGTYVTFFRSNPGISGFNWNPELGWGWYQVATNVVAPPPGDGNGGTGYDSLDEKKVAKNTLVVGAIRNITKDPYNKSDLSMSMSEFSSWGPTDDGRIKPDVVANGVDVWSSYAESDTSYESETGTSFAAPSVTGTATLLIEHYQNLFHSSPRSATTKGLLIHNAFDAGNVGPDYAFGWGVVDGAAAANFLTNLSNPDSSNLLFEGTYAGIEQSFTVTSDGTNPLKATIVWTDPAGPVQGNGLDVRTPVLVNNLDLWITGPDGIYYPWTLDPANPANPAVQTSANNLDNVEQVLIDAPTPGEYKIHVGHSDDSFVQDYSLLASGVDIPPDLVVTSLRTTGLGSVDENYFIQPIEVVVQNQGSLPAEPFKVSVDYQVEGQPSYVVAFTADETSDVNADSVWYPFTKDDLAPGAEVTFTGELTFHRDSLTDDISLWAIADSISGDEFMPDYGRVEESIEINNQSNPITLSLVEDLPLDLSLIIDADSSIFDDSFSFGDCLICEKIAALS